MHQRMYLALALSLTAHIGCRSVDNAQVDLLERELRQQEDYIYELEDYLVEYSEKLRECRCTDPAHSHPTPYSNSSGSPEIIAAPSSKNEIPEPELADDPPQSRRTDSPVPDLADELPPEPLPAPTDDDVDSPAPDEIDVDDLDEIDVPDLEIGPSTTAIERGGAELAAGVTDARPGLIPDPVDYQETSEGYAIEAYSTESPSAEPSDDVAGEPIVAELQQSERREPDRIVVRRLLADENLAANGMPGGLLVVVEALNELGEPVDVEGLASLMVLTPAGGERQRRIDRWDFSEEETSGAWQSTQLGDGLHLQLPLDRRPLGEGKYELWARVATNDGRKWLTKQMFEPGSLLTLAEAEAQEMIPQEQYELANDPVQLADAAESHAAAPIESGSSTPADEKSTAGGWKRSASPIISPGVARTASSTSAAGRWTRSSHADHALQGARRRPSASGASQPRWTPFK